MKFSVISILGLATAAFAAPASILSVSYDETYDNAQTSIATLSCSDGENGLLGHGWTVLGNVPKFPHVAGVSAIAGWNSPNCGTCWRLTYKGNNVTVLGVDVSKEGVNLSLQAMNELTKNNAKSLGRVQAAVEQVDVKECGL